MKKIIFLIVVSICVFFCTDNVFAKNSSFSGMEFLDGVSYVKYDGSYYYFRNAQVIRNLDTWNVAYCLEPFSSLIDGSVYSGYDNYSEIFNLSLDQWNRVKLLAHYGYGYGNHYEEKWITVTQFLIWRTVDSNSSFNWLDNLNDRNIVYPYENEILELEKLVSEHNLLPNISSNIKISINNTNIINDSNNVLNKFEIIESDFDAYINGNDLIINSRGIASGKIKFKSKQYSNSGVSFFYSPETQSVVESGNVESLYFEVEVEVIAGKLTIKKVDSETKDIIPQGSAELVGAVYEVFNEYHESVGEVVIGDGSIGTLGNLKFGDYYIKEIKSGIGYYINETLRHKFTVNSDNFDVNLILENKVLTSNIKIIKHYGTVDDYINGEMKKESGITFRIYDESNLLIYEGITNCDGVLEFVLPYGKYVIKQINTTEGYGLSEDINISVDEGTNISITLNIYDYEIEVPNASISFFDYIFDLFLNIKELISN